MNNKISNFLLGDEIIRTPNKELINIISSKDPIKLFMLFLELFFTNDLVQKKRITEFLISLKSEDIVIYISLFIFRKNIIIL